MAQQTSRRRSWPAWAAKVLLAVLLLALTASIYRYVALTAGHERHFHIHGAWLDRGQRDEPHQQTITERLVFGGDSVYPPFEWSEAGAPTGFNVDLARAIAHAGGFAVEHRLAHWADIVEALERGEIDVAPMMISAEREERFLFGTPFYHLSHAVYSHEDAPSVSSPHELANQRVAVEGKSYAHKRLAEEHPEVRLVLVASTLGAMEAVASDVADYALLATPSADFLIQSKHLSLRRTGPPIWSAPYALAVRKDRPGLAKQLNDGLHSTFADGTYDHVYAHWESLLTPSDTDRRRLISVVIPVISILICLILFGFGWSWVLSHTVAKRTKQLAEELARRERAETSLRRVADFDPDSDLPNATCFVRQVDQILDRGRLAAPDSVRKQVAVIQLLELRKIVTTFGYEAGLRFMQAFAAFLGTSGFDVCGHLGRDAFVVLSDADAMESCLNALSEELEGGSLGYSSHVLVGRAKWPDDGGTTGELIRRAETALAHCIVRKVARVDYDSGMEPSQLDLQLIRDFNYGAQDQLYPVFQPQIDLSTGSICGAEALIRWHHPQLGPVSPAKFIPLLEDTGLIAVVTNRMIDEAARMAAALRASGLACTISVNVAARDLASMQLIDVIAAALNRHDCLADDLALELTETGMVAQPEVVRDMLEKLSEMGVTASVDDFGTGFASLAYLSIFPVREVKIDRMFIKDMLSNTRNRSIVRSTIEMAHKLDLRVVAEGVEDLATLEALREAGSDRAQGFYIARPLKETEFTDFLASRRVENVACKPVLA